MTQEEKEAKLAIFIAILESIESQTEKLYSGISYRIDNNLDWHKGYTKHLNELIKTLKIYTPKS